MNTTASPLLTTKESAAFETIHRNGSITTRIKELGDGDRDSVQLPLLAPSSGADPLGPRAMAEGDMLTCLHALESRGLIVCTIHVHTWSATEYICEWTLAIRWRIDHEACGRHEAYYGLRITTSVRPTSS